MIDPKHIEPSKWAKEVPNQQLKVAAGKLFCVVVHVVKNWGWKEVQSGTTFNHRSMKMAKKH